jgi:hypothetical protein
LLLTHLIRAAERQAADRWPGDALATDR